MFMWNTFKIKMSDIHNHIRSMTDDHRMKTELRFADFMPKTEALNRWITGVCHARA